MNKMKKDKINEGHYLELMDRLYIQICSVEDHLLGHPLTKKIKKVKKLIENAGIELAEAYQIVGEHWFENEQKNETKKTLSRRHKKPKD